MTKFSPGQTNIYNTKLTVSGLTPANLLKFRIYAENKINSVAPKEKWKYKEVFIKTKSGKFFTKYLSVFKVSKDPFAQNYFFGFTPF